MENLNITTLKCWAENEYFLMCGLVNCRACLNLMTLYYNFKRALYEIGVEIFIAYCRARMVVQGSSVFFLAKIAIKSGLIGEFWINGEALT